MQMQLKQIHFDIIYSQFESNNEWTFLTKYDQMITRKDKEPFMYTNITMCRPLLLIYNNS